MINLSIIVPIYNVEKYIRRCLDSVINQGLPENEYEVIIVDDGSTDASYQIASEYAKNRSNFHIIRQKNSGSSSVPRNVGLDVAKGRYIWFIDGDDALLPYSLKSVYKYIQGPIRSDNDHETQMPQIVCFGAIEGRDDVMDLSNLKELECEEKIEIGSGCDYLAKHDYIQAVWWYFVEKNLIDDLGLRFEEGVLSEDVPFTATLFIEAKNIISVNKQVYYYAYNAGSDTRSASPSKLIKFKNGLVYANVALNSILKRYSSMPSDCQQRLIRKRDNGLRTALAI